MNNAEKFLKKARMEKVVTSLIEIEEVSPKNLTKEERGHLKRTLSYMRKGRHDKFMSLDEFERRLNLS